MNSSPKTFKVSVAIALIFLALSAILTHKFLFKQTISEASSLTQNIPKQIGRWTSMYSSKPSQGEINGLETTDILKRNYFDGVTPIEVVVAYIAKSTRKSAHAQEACLRGSGSEVSNITIKRMDKIDVTSTRIEMEFRDRKFLVNYWYKSGNLYTSKYLESSLIMFWNGLFGGESKGTALVRLSLPIPAHSKSVNETQAILEEFTSYLIPELERYLP